MPTTQTIRTSASKATCLNILNRLAKQELDRVIIAERGRTAGVLTPPDQLAGAMRNTYGFMRGSVIIADDVGLTVPILDEPLTVQNGDLHG